MATLAENPAVCRRVACVVQAVAPHPALYQDLLQEARLRLFLSERRKAGQKLSWYLQHCRFHIVDKLRQGRSLDSVRRAHLGCEFDEMAAENVPLSRHDVVSEACAHDAFDRLSSALKPRERRILSMRHEGFTDKEIAAELHITERAVNKARHRIAEVAKRLGIEP